MKGLSGWLLKDSNSQYILCCLGSDLHALLRLGSGHRAATLGLERWPGIRLQVQATPGLGTVCLSKHTTTHHNRVHTATVSKLRYHTKLSANTLHKMLHAILTFTQIHCLFNLHL